MLNTVLSQILEGFGGAYELWNADEKALKEKLSEKRCKAILESRDENKIKEYKKKLDDRNISFVYPGHCCYPEKLLNIPDCPSLLYVKGNIEELNNPDRQGIAIVGARNASHYGIANAREFGYTLAGYGISIISGLASGIDTEAHKAAMDAESFSIGVLGCGINICYPKENYGLFEQMCKKGAIISEYGLDVPPDHWRFPPRNRIISGLSDGVLVVEAREKSGSLITADQALEQGREVYAIPGRIYDKNSTGCNNLIKMGATCVTEPMDIIHNMNLMYNYKDNLICNGKKGEVVSISEFNHLKQMKDLSEAERNIYSCIGKEPVYVEDICRKSHMPATEVLLLLYELEKKNFISQPVRNYYIIKI
jgi:DNA processing protein